ncbi:DivIVA domain-containing protein [Actinokineospora sp. UTMC 2448]|uniref:DivIVA domain-containing protein n=1 Tax=Actinokineospora sp. UTMC 2448 TaxID=2268449 RepID=UPI002164CB62|nr:DivIVA domain-containing protein [Actinokineospora sp. UTMC 2448]UVS76949.1 Antigen 84 [Actinokineospora sp. UTMC 2448]
MKAPLTPHTVRAVTFDRAPLGRRGYHEEQVDAFLDRVEAALSGGAPLTPDDVRAAVFDQASRIRRGYDEDQVDAFLDAVVVTLSEGAANRTVVIQRVVTPPDVVEVPFLPLPPAPPNVRGYRPDDVDRLSRLLTAAAKDPANAPTAAQLAQLRLTLTPLVGQGYDPRTVDALVDAWTLDLRRREA